MVRFNSNGYFYSSFNATNLNMKSFANSILRLFPSGGAPLYALTGEVNKGKAKSVTHGYWTKHMVYTSITINGAVASGATTTITVDSTAGLIKGMVFQIPHPVRTFVYALLLALLYLKQIVDLAV